MNLYAWFHPNYTSADLMELSIRNINQDGVLTVVTDVTYTSADLNDASWNWFNAPWENGMDISDPYDWEGYNSKICSFTKTINIEGVKVGVIGSDMIIGDLNNLLLQETFLEKGHYALLNSALEFLVHPTHTGENWANLYTEDLNRTTELLMDNTKVSGVFLTIVAVALISVMSLILARGISKPLGLVSDYLGILAEGDFTTVLDKSILKRKDEIGKLGSSSTLMVEKLSVVISGVHSSSVNVE